MQVEQELDFHCLYGIADKDGPLRNEVRLGVSKLGALDGELYTARSWRSVPIITVMVVCVVGRPMTLRLCKSVEGELVRLNAPRREGRWWVVEPSTLIGATAEVASLERIKLRTKEDAALEFEEALRRKMMESLR